MRKIQILGAAFFAVLALGAVTSVSASAAQWLNLEGKALTQKEPATTAGLLLLHVFKVNALLGGGNITFHCDGLFKGSVGPGAEDLVELATNLAGLEPDNVACEVQESTNSFCKNGATAHLKPDNLNWHTLLVEEPAGLVWDEFESEPAGKEVGYSVECSGLSGLCASLKERAHFKENTGEGALFEFLGEKHGTCSNAEFGTVLGHGVVLGFVVH